MRKLPFVKTQSGRLWSIFGAFLILLTLSVAINNFPALTATENAQKPHKNPKLSTPLHLLSMNAKQEASRPAVAEAVRPPEGFSRDTLPKALRDAIHAGQMQITENAEVQVYIEMNVTDSQNLDELRSYGVTVQIVGQPKPDKNKGEVLTRVPTVQGLLPVSMINQVTALSFVRYIRLPDYGVKNSGSVDSQGDRILQTVQARQQFGVDGTGVKVGVISDGIGGIFATGCTTCGPTTGTPSPITLGDLPNATGTRNSSGILTSVSGGIIAKSFRSDGSLEPPATDTTSGQGAEGTAMLEIVHDLAPGAQLYFANGGTSMEFEQAVDYIAVNADIGVDDLSFHTPPFDGTSAVSTNTATALNTDTNPVRGYFTAVANQAFDHWGEPWTDSGQNLTLACPASQGGTSETGHVQLLQATANTKDATNFGPSVADFLLLPNGQTLTVSLSWNDPYSGSSNDYDLFLYLIQNNTLVTPLQCSISPQTGTQPPVEVLYYTNNSGATQQVGIMIQNVNNAAAPRNFDVFVDGIGNSQNLNFYTPSGSVPAQADAGGSPVSVVSVGATDAQVDANGNQPGTIVEPFSSQGPTQATPQAAARMKPDVTATDGVSVTGASGFGVANTLASSSCAANNPSPPGCYFFGSSAASPHVAAIAALTLQAAPCLLSTSTINKPAIARTNLRNFITSTAVPLPGISQSVPNNVEGFGLVDALAAISTALPTVNAGQSQTVNATSANGASVTFGGSATDPNSCPVTLSWTGSCGTASGASANLTCPIGSDAETITASNGGVTASQPTSTVQITVSDFSNTLSPTSTTITAGQTANYTVTIASKFGAFTNPVSLACSGLPSLSQCAFSPASVIPGSSSFISTLSISTTAPSSVFPPAEPRIPNVPIFVLWLSLTLVIAGLAILARNSGRKRGFAVASCALLICIVLPIFSCGVGKGGGTPHNPGTPTGAYAITVTGSSNQLQHSSTVTLNIQ
jgi:hypothetical protein